jgi:hypothetical protein
MKFWFYFVGDVKPAMQSVVKLINKELDVTNDEEVRIVESTQKNPYEEFFTTSFVGFVEKSHTPCISGYYNPYLWNVVSKSHYFL